jgi:pantetheine-phosphate adenylyltransferase
MELLHIYPGTFCPPHYGHVAVAKEAADLFGKLVVICSVNPVKKDRIIFTPEECKEMWQTYALGPNIEVVTLDEFLARWNRSAPAVMVRGIRDNNDIIYENDVILYNCRKFGIRHYHYILCEKKYKGISSTKARAAAMAGNAAALKKFVNPAVTARILEHAKSVIPTK